MAVRRRAERLRVAYEQRLAGIRAEISRRLAAEYDVNPNDVQGSIAAFIERAEPIVAAGQASASGLASAFLVTYAAAAAGVEVELADSPIEPGVTRAGVPLAEGMAAFGPMVLGQIADGKPLDEAIAFGQYLADRFGDSEVVAAADTEFEVQAKAATQVIGWEGTVEPDSCDPCLAQNDGRHGLDDPFYRHGSCRCERVPVFG